MFHYSFLYKSVIVRGFFFRVPLFIVLMYSFLEVSIAARVFINGCAFCFILVKETSVNVFVGVLLPSVSNNGDRFAKISFGVQVIVYHYNWPTRVVNFHFFLCVKRMPLSGAFSFINRCVKEGRPITKDLAFLFLRRRVMMLDIMSVNNNVLGVECGIFNNGFFGARRSFTVRVRASILVFRFNHGRDDAIASDMALCCLRFIIWAGREVIFRMRLQNRVSK